MMAMVVGVWGMDRFHFRFPAKQKLLGRGGVIFFLTGTVQARTMTMSVEEHVVAVLDPSGMAPKEMNSHHELRTASSG